MRTQATSGNKPVLLVRIIKTPIQALQKAKDIYTKCITSFSTTYNRPMMIIQDANRTTMLVTNHSPHQGLTRASSSVAGLEGEMIRRRDRKLLTCASRKGVPRSCSVVMGRIDEDIVSSFREDIILFKKMVVVSNIDTRLSGNNSYAAGDTR